MFDEIIGHIDHRILLNYRIDPKVAAKVLPLGFRPKIVKGFAIGGICQVSLSKMRVKGFPKLLGLSSHNAAHRIAVETDVGEGVYVPRRDTNSVMNVISGGRFFPGSYSKADFQVDIDDGDFSVNVTANSNRIMSVQASISQEMSGASIFKEVEQASKFFKGGNVGWSPQNAKPIAQVSAGGGSVESQQEYDRIDLQTDGWAMTPLEVKEQHSSYFSDLGVFPEGSVEFDSGLLMSNLVHQPP